MAKLNTYHFETFTVPRVVEDHEEGISFGYGIYNKKGEFIMIDDETAKKLNKQARKFRKLMKNVKKIKRHI